MELILLTGFLGAGKTTLLQRLLSECVGQKIGVIVNEFGQINIDAALLQHDGMEIAELSNGSIFCACIKEQFVSSLIAMSRYDLEYLFIEASGLADPANMQSILDGIAHKTHRPLHLRQSVCVLDAVHFLKLVTLLPALERQLLYADVVLINKADLVDEAQVARISREIRSRNPQASILLTIHCRVRLQQLLQSPEQARRTAAESVNTRRSRPYSLVLHSAEPLDPDALRAFVQNLAPDAYRIKGFAQTTQGNLQVSTVSGDVSLIPWQKPLLQTELVVISAIGIRIVSRITAASQQLLQGKLHIGAAGK